MRENVPNSNVRRSKFGTSTHGVGPVLRYITIVDVSTGNVGCEVGSDLRLCWVNTVLD